MDTKSKLFSWVFFIAILIVVLMSFLKFYVFKDYNIKSQASCDPLTEKCFVHICDPNPKIDKDSCTGDLSQDTWFTKNIIRKAKNIPLCDPNKDDCQALVCQENEFGCEYELCNQDNVPDGDYCNDPEEYIRNSSPIEVLQENSGN